MKISEASGSTTGGGNCRMSEALTDAKEPGTVGRPELQGQGTRQPYENTPLGKFQNYFDHRTPIAAPTKFFLDPPPAILEMFQEARIHVDRYYSAMFEHLLNMEKKG